MYIMVWSLNYLIVSRQLVECYYSVIIIVRQFMRIFDGWWSWSSPLHLGKNSPGDVLIQVDTTKIIPNILCILSHTKTTWRFLLSYFLLFGEILQKLLKTFGQTWWLCIPPRTLGVRPNFGIGFVQDGVCDDFSSTFYTATWHSRR